MTRYVAARLLGLFGLLWGVATLAFLLAHAAPGDPAELFLERAYGRPPADAQVTEMRAAMGLDRPLVEQYGRWLLGLVRGDLGRSWATGQPVISALAGGLAPTVQLAVAALLCALLLGVPLGMAAAARPGAIVDHLTRLVAVAGVSLPSFVVGYLLVLVFAVGLRMVPVFGAGSAAHLVLPALTLALASAATYARIVRAGLIAALTEEHVRAARAKGLTRGAVLVRHALPHALLPVLTLAALSFANLLGGAVIVESVFAWPGLGRLTVEAIHARDYPLVQGIVLLAGAAFGLVNLVADLAYGWIDPRVRVAARA